VTGEQPHEAVLGRIGGAFGVQGWVKIESFTQQPETLFDYVPWRLRSGRGERECRVLEHRRHGTAKGKGFVARVDAAANREEAARLTGALIVVATDKLPPTGPNEYYWASLEGLRVLTIEGVDLGRVAWLFATGANDVLVVESEDANKRERWIPFIPDVIREVDIAAGRMVVDWDPEF
jgi:16S rRNA processing protein RimM